MDGYFAANAVLSIFSKDYMELKRGLPIRPSEMGALNIITGTPGPHTPALLANLLGVSKPMITAHLTDLAKKGYIERKQSPEDGRVFYVLPTEKALALAKRAGAKLERQLEELARGMGREDFERLVEPAQKANQILEANRAENEQIN